jgi:hypothetical protein
MGLDMYLTKRVYVGAEYEHRNVKGTIDINIGDEKLPVNFNKVSEIIERAGYWRKANHIHAWFVENIQDGEDDCGDYYVSEEKMKELLGVVNQVLANHDLAEELLPTQSGFFFGGNSYDEYYFLDLEYTKEILEGALKSSGEFYYHSSW